MAAHNVCHYNKFGFCKYKERCMQIHIDDPCDDFDCDAKMCNRRHPRECKYFRYYKRCKFDPCKFTHIDKMSENLNQIRKIKDSIDVKIAEIDAKMDKLNEEMKDIENQRTDENPADNNFIERIENKFAVFESNLEILKKTVCEKDSYIITLEEKISKIVEENLEQKQKIKKLGQQIQVISESSSRMVTIIHLSAAPNPVVGPQP